MTPHSEIREDAEEKLIDVLPYILSGRQLKSQPFYIVNTVHLYTRDILGILFGLGLSIPLAKLLWSNSPALGSQLSGLPLYLSVPAWIFTVVIAFFKVYVTRESVERRAHLVDECEREFDLKYLEIVNALKKEKPMPELNLISNNVSTLVMHHRREKSYTFRTGFAPGADIEAKIHAEKLCDDNEKRWVE